ncbi:MAG: ATP-binding protein [Candidatus Eremiobacterota bacterium]
MTVIYNNKILIADDGKVFLMMYKKIFSRKKEGNVLPEEKNFDPAFFENGKDLLEHFKWQYSKGVRIPLCILDYMMPFLDGMETGKEIRKIDRDVIILMVTSIDLTLDEISESLQENIYYIKKPFVVNELYCLVDSLVKGWNKNLNIQRQKIELEEAYNKLKMTHSQLLHREKMASIGQLAAGVAHEINNPAGFIAGNLRALNKYTKKLTDFIEFQSEIIKSHNTERSLSSMEARRKQLKIDYVINDLKDLIDESLEGADRIKKIVENLKSFSRVDESNYKEANINECIESTINIVWNELKYKATVKKEYGSIREIKCYPQELNQVFLNLLINASQAIEKHGEITVKTWEEEDSIFISVSDTGYGIKEEHINRIFEPFFTTKDVGKGTGLGLSICYDIIKKHNGEIKVESTPGKGSIFTIKLPYLQT